MENLFKPLRFAGLIGVSALAILALGESYYGSLLKAQPPWQALLDRYRFRLSNPIEPSSGSGAVPIHVFPPLYPKAVADIALQRGAYWRGNRLVTVDEKIGPPPANARYRESFVSETGKTLFQSENTIDEHGRRRVPSPATKPGASFLAVLGCGYAFGSGVNDDEALPSRLAALLPQATVYNYGAADFGPSTVLQRLENSPMAAEIPQKHGIGLYVFVDENLRRTLNTMNWMASPGKQNSPVFEQTGAEGLTYRGTFSEIHPWLSKIYPVLAKSNILTYFGGDFPRPSEDKLRFVALHLRQIQREFVAAFPGQEFVVVFFPKASMLYAASMRRYLDEFGVKYLDYSSLPVEQYVKGPLWLADMHPTAGVYAFLAKQLAADISPLFAAPAAKAQARLR